ADRGSRDVACHISPASDLGGYRRVGGCGARLGVGQGPKGPGEEPRPLSLRRAEARGMRSVFADTSYWVALLNPRDTLHARVKSLYPSLDGARLVTSEMVVLTELLNDFAGRGEALRTTAVRAIERLREEPQVFIAPQTSPLFREAFVLYSTRGDK